MLLTITKIFERILFDQLTKFSNKIFSPLLCGFRKGYSTQYAFVNLLLKLIKSIDEPDGTVGTLLMDSFKAYDCVNHELIIAKLAAYGLNKGSLRLIQNYLSKRKHRGKIGFSLSKWLEIILGVPQGSILGPVLFNIFINALLLFIKETDVCNFAEDTTLYKCGSDLDIALENLEMDANIAINWLNNNEMVANPKKIQLMFLARNKSIEKEVSFVGKAMISSNTVELLGITLDKNLNFKSHIENVCCKANNKIKALFRI